MRSARRFSKQVSTPLTLGLLGAAAGVSFLLPDTLTPPATFAADPPPDEIRLIGIVYDFLESHPDFAVVPNDGYGHYAGNVDPQLSTDGRPVFVGLGSGEFAELKASGGLVFTDPFGYETPFPDSRSDLNKNVIATRTTIPVDVTVDAITSYVGLKDKELRYGLYSDSGGEPGTLIVETGKIKMPKDTMEWLAGPVPSTVVPAGTYWLAISFQDDDQHYAFSAGTGTSVKQLDYDAVGKGFESNWSGSDSSATEAVAIFATYTTGNEPMIGDNLHPTLTKMVEKQQIATRVDMPEDGTLLSITAYVGLNDKLVRYALYADGGGKPGVLLVETFEEKTLKSAMQWQTIYLDDLPLTAGTYWLALSFEEKNQNMATAADGGLTHHVAHEAATDGFRPNWGSSDNVTTERISIYGTYTTETSDTSYLGFKVMSQWRDGQSQPIAPNLAGIGSDDAIEFDIVNQGVIPAENFALETRVLGAAIQTSAGGYHRPVTMKLTVGGVEFEPFGPYNDAVLGNVNDDQTVTCDSNGTNPRCDVIGTFPAGTDIAVHGRSWLLDDEASKCAKNAWAGKMEASTFDDDVQIKVLRNGDPVPDVDGVYDQASAANYIGDFVDEGTGRMIMSENQVIYLFELGTSGGSSSADFQDLVVLITMADDPAGLCGTIGSGGTTICGSVFGDTDGEGKPAGQIDSSGGITSAATFAEWYNLVLGSNVATAHEIVLVNDGTGSYEFLQDEFHPIDDEGLGNEGDDHNYYFTFRFRAKFDYERCANMFIEFEGDDDVWLFVNDELVMDRGGMRPGTTQYVSMDRLGLVDGAKTTVRFFHAQRQSDASVFRLRTNIRLEGANQVAVSDMYD